MREKFKQLTKLSGIYTLGNVAERGLSFILLPLYTTYLSTYEFGVIAIMTASVSFFVTFVSVPPRSGFVRHYYAPEFKNKRETIFFNSLIYIILVSVPVAVLLVFLRRKIAFLLLGDTGLANVILFYSVVIVASPLRMLVSSLLRVQKRAILFSVVSVSRLAANAGLVVFLLIFTKIRLMALVYGALLASLFDLVVLAPYLARNIKFSVSPSIMKPLLKFGFPVVFSSIGLTLMNLGDRFILKMYASLEDVGIYAVGCRFGSLVLLLLVTPTKRALNPIVYEMESDGGSLRDFVARTAVVYYFFALLLCLLITLFAKEIIETLVRKPEFWPSAIVIPWIAYSSVWSGLCDLFGKGMMMAKKTFHTGVTFFVAAACNLLLNLLLIPRFGIVGAAIATLLSFIVLGALNAYYSKKFYQQYFDFKMLATISAVGAAAFVLGELAVTYCGMAFSIVVRLLVVAAYFLIGYNLRLVPRISELTPRFRRA